MLEAPSFPQVIVSVFPDHDATDRERWPASGWPQIPSSLVRNQVQTPQTTSNYAEAASLPLRSDYRRRWFIGANLSVFGYCDLSLTNSGQPAIAHSEPTYENVSLTGARTEFSNPHPPHRPLGFPHARRRSLAHG